MNEIQAEEKLRVIDIIKENSVSFITIGGLVWVLFSYVILPIQKMQFQITNILDNHLSTIQIELTEAKVERENQGKLLTSLSEQIIRLTVELETK